MEASVGDGGDKGAPEGGRLCRRSVGMSGEGSVVTESREVEEMRGKGD
jgi:hypothetical protein